MAKAETDHAWWDWKVFGLWIVANSLAYVVIPLAGALIEELVSSGTRDLVGNNRDVSILILAVAAALLQGIAWGRLQWWVLKRRVPELERRRWVIATIVPVFLMWLLVLAPAAVDAIAKSGDTLDVFRNGFIQALVFGPLIGLGQAVALRGLTRRWLWWVIASLTTYLSGALLHRLIELWVHDGGLNLPSWTAYYFPVLAFALYGVWLLWITAPRTIRRSTGSSLPKSPGIAS